MHYIKSYCNVFNLYEYSSGENGTWHGGWENSRRGKLWLKRKVLLLHGVFITGNSRAKRKWVKENNRNMKIVNSVLFTEHKRKSARLPSVMQWKLAQILVHRRIHILCVCFRFCVCVCVCDCLCQALDFAIHCSCCCHTLTIILVIVVAAGSLFCFCPVVVIVVHATRMKTWKNWRKALI